MDRITAGVAGALLFSYVPWMKITGALIKAVMVGIQYLGPKDEGAALRPAKAPPAEPYPKPAGS